MYILRRSIPLYSEVSLVMQCNRNVEHLIKVTKFSLFPFLNTSYDHATTVIAYRRDCR